MASGSRVIPPSDSTGGYIGQLQVPAGFVYAVTGSIEAATDPTNAVKAASLQCTMTVDGMGGGLVGAAAFPADGSTVTVPINAGFVDTTQETAATTFLGFSCTPTGPDGVSYQFNAASFQALPLDEAFESPDARTAGASPQVIHSRPRPQH